MKTSPPVPERTQWEHITPRTSHKSWVPFWPPPRDLSPSKAGGGGGGGGGPLAKSTEPSAPRPRGVGGRRRRPRPPGPGTGRGRRLEYGVGIMAAGGDAPRKEAQGAGGAGEARGTCWSWWPVGPYRWTSRSSSGGLSSTYGGCSYRTGGERPDGWYRWSSATQSNTRRPLMRGGSRELRGLWWGLKEQVVRRLDGGRGRLSAWESGTANTLSVYNSPGFASVDCEQL